MSFTVEHSIEKLWEKEISGKYLDAAVDCWFTSTGRSIPRMVKIENDTGERVTLCNIRIRKEEQKFYAGIQAKKYWCEAENCGMIKQFYLLFYPEQGKWKMVV